jgi:hypothetical protein
MNRRAWRQPIAVAAMALATSIWAGAQRSDTAGMKETQNFVKAGEKASQSIADAKTQIQNTLGAYNSLVTQPSDDMKGDYKKLLNAVKDMDEKLGDARAEVDRMEKVGTTYFAGRTVSIKSIQDADLRDQAQKRLDENQAAYSDVLASFREAGNSLEPMRKDLSDQINYLGSDLTPGATASLRPQAERLNQRGVEVFAKTDRALGTANAYFASMRPAGF